MKKILLFTLLLPIFCQAQPVINSDIYPSNGTEIMMADCEAPDPQRDIKGENVTWDFSNLECDGTWTFSFNDADQSNVADQFPNANQSVGINFGDFGIEVFYDFNKDYWAHSGFDYDGYIFSSVDQSEERLLNFPTNYQDTWSNDFYYLNPSYGDFALGTATYTVDGYGTLITPSGTFENVIRVYSERTEQNMFTFETFTYYSSNYEYQLLHMLVDDEAQYQVDPLLITSSTEIAKNSALQIYPNPILSGGDLHIEFEHDTQVQIDLYSMDGRKLQSQKYINFAENAHVLQLDKSLVSGMYLLVLQTDEIRHTTKLRIE